MVGESSGGVGVAGGRCGTVPVLENRELTDGRQLQIFTAIVPAIDHMNYPVFLIGWPLSLVSNTFFPIEPDNPVLWALMQLNPIYQLAESARGLMVLGDPGPHLLGLLGSSVLWLVPSTLVAVRLTRRRVLGD